MEVIAIPATVAALAIAIITYFLKKVFGQVDDNSKGITEIKENYVSQDGLDRFEENIKEIVVKNDERCSRLDEEIKNIKEKYITRDDFYREQEKTEKKLDKIMDLLMEMNKRESRA